MRTRENDIPVKVDAPGATAMTTVAELVAAAQGHIEELDAARFAAEAVEPDTVVVDLREADERLRGTIRGAVHVPRGVLEFRADPASVQHDPRLDPARRLLVHSEGGERSALAVRTLQTLGYSDVAHLRCGLSAWRAAGLPLVNEVVQPY